MNLLSGVESDFHHTQKNPGAYEWWHFDGTDDTSGYSFSAQFYAGHLLSPYYQEALKAYLANAQSPLLEQAPAPNPPNPLTVSPPNPLDYSGVTFRIFRKGTLIGESLQEYGPGQLKASDRQPAFLLGSNRFNWEPKADPPSYTVTLQGSVKGGQQLLRARLFFTPESLSIPSLEPPPVTSTHTWILAAPRCHVEGTLQWCNAEGEVQREQVFVGKGYHDHHFGTVPIGRFIKSWHWGRAFFRERTVIYSYQTYLDEKEKPAGILLLAQKGNPSLLTRELSLGMGKNRRNFFWIPYEKELKIVPVPQGISGRTGKLEVRHETILVDGPVSLIFQDQVDLTGLGADAAKDITGSGMSNYLYTPRLSSRFFFPMLKGKTTVVEKPKEELPLDTNQPRGDVFTNRPDLPQ